MPKWKVPYRRVLAGTAVVEEETAGNAVLAFYREPYDFVDEDAEECYEISPASEHEVFEVVG